jgi:pyruvate, water dikinase
VTPVFVRRLGAADGAAAVDVAGAGASADGAAVDVAGAGVAAVGGKAAGLSELIRAGLPVPPGYVVLTGAFGLALAGLDPSLVLAIQDAPAEQVAAAASRLRERITAMALPDQVAAQIAAAYEALGAGGPAVPVAVRSSATMEDSPTASFAGLQDTYLAVCGATAVLDAVRRCWASLYNDESVTYRRRLGLPERGLAMSVVVSACSVRARPG